MSPRIWLGVLGASALYVGAALLLGFEGAMAVAINFGRVALAVAVLILYLPAITQMFKEVPAPRRDYLLAGIILTWLSAVSFATWNEAGRLFGVQTSIFLSPIAGFFSFLLVIGAAFHIIAPGTANRRSTIIAIAVGAVVAAGLVLIAPLFR